MCTLTVIPGDDGYHLGMNRDERLSRGLAAPPTRVNLDGSSAIYPRDSAGGTWIAANQRGFALALLNLNEVRQASEMPPNARSRGLIIPALISSSSLQGANQTFSQIDLTDTAPFRLVGVFPAEMKIQEWRWDRKSLESEVYGWEFRQWFSSSLSDAEASTLRGAACKSAWDEDGAGSLPWLRRLHASHVNGPGPFSVCVHRENVRTVSYTEITASKDRVECEYFSGSPCTMKTFESSVEIARRPLS